jgi:hypothetical protein
MPVDRVAVDRGSLVKGTSPSPNRDKSFTTLRAAVVAVSLPGPMHKIVWTEAKVPSGRVEGISPRSAV